MKSKLGTSRLKKSTGQIVQDPTKDHNHMILIFKYLLNLSSVTHRFPVIWAMVFADTLDQTWRMGQAGTTGAAGHLDFQHVDGLDFQE